MSVSDFDRIDYFLLWVGESEYEGVILVAEGSHFAARLRHVQRWSLSGTSPAGRSVPLDLLERQRHLTRGSCFAQSPGIQEAALLEVRVESVQRSRDPELDYVLSGTFRQVSDEHLETLSRLSRDAAATLLAWKRRTPGRAEGRG